MTETTRERSECSDLVATQFVTPTNFVTRETNRAVLSVRGVDKSHSHCTYFVELEVKYTWYVCVHTFVLTALL